jgi:hypothetical protein
MRSFSIFVALILFLSPVHAQEVDNTIPQGMVFEAEFEQKTAWLVINKHGVFTFSKRDDSDTCALIVSPAEFKDGKIVLKRGKANTTWEVKEIDKGLLLTFPIDGGYSVTYRKTRVNPFVKCGLTGRSL